MLNGISNFEWKRMKNLVNRQQLLFTETEWHSNFGFNLCKICWEKHYKAFVKVVEGSEIYNFAIHPLVHFSFKIWRKTQLHVVKPKRKCRPRRRPCPATSASGPRPRLPEAARASKSVPAMRQAATCARPTGRAPPCPSVRPVPSLPHARLPRYDRRTAALTPKKPSPRRFGVAHHLPRRV
jgi:hypothetical protein